MGGGIETVTSNKNIANTSDDLNLVYCSVDLISGNQALFDRSVLFKKFSGVAAKYLKDNGVKYKIEGPASLGNGGLGFFFDVLKQLWSNKEIFGILFLIAKQVPKLLVDSPFADKPRVYVSLRIKSGKELDYVKNRDLEQLLVDRLINLKNLSDGLCDLLEKQYPIFAFDQSFGARLLAISFRVSYLIPHEKCTAFNKSRLIRLFKSVRVKNNLDSNYVFNKFNFVEGTNGKTTYEGESWMGDRKRNKYFFFVSSRIISDYL